MQPPPLLVWIRRLWLQVFPQALNLTDGDRTEGFSLLQWITIGGMIGVFLADSLTPLGFAHGSLYGPLVLLAVATKNPYWLGGTAALSLVLTGAGYWISAPPPPGFPAIYIVVNRCLSGLLIISLAAISLYLLRLLEQIQASQNQLMAFNEALQEQKQILEIASRIGRLGGWYLDLATGRMRWSAEIARIHAVDPDFSPTLEEAVQFYLPESQSSMRQALSACSTIGVPFDQEWQLCNIQGQRIWVRSIGQAVRNPAGQIIALHGALQDVTTLKQSEQVAQISEQRFRQLADAMPLIVWTADPDGTVDYASQTLRDYTGIQDPAPHPSQHWLTLLHPDDRDPCVAAWMESVQAEKPYQFEFRLLRHDGQYCWHLVQALPIRDESGALIKWYGTSIEIQDQKRLQEEAQELANRLRRTLESITDAFLTMDHEWRFTFLNQQAERLLQRSRQELMGHVAWEVFPDAEGSIFQTEYIKAIETQESRHFQGFFEPLESWFDIYVYPSTEGVALYFQDVTERKALENQLRQSQRLEAVGQLTGGVAHDFNNLLTVILGSAELLAEEMTPGSPQCSLAEMIINAARRGADLTQGLLAFSRRQALDPQPVDVNALIVSMDGLLRRTLGGNIEIRQMQEHPGWSALIDPAQLESSILNLCINARDAMPDGGQLTIETSMVELDSLYASQQSEVEPGSYVLVAISDTGFGIPAKQLSQVFEPFFTTKPLGKGSGLGLSMVYGFIKQSQGHIKIYSEEEVGTTVRMYLPRYWGEAKPQVVEAGDSVRLGGSERILLVEDDELVLEYACQQLQLLGYDVLTAPNGPEALALIQQHEDIDLLFTDVMMPGGMSGRELAEAAHAIRPNLKVLYTSGYTENAIVHHGRLDPGVQLLSKPYSRLELAQKVRYVLKN